jgi:hypothetical protein
MELSSILELADKAGVILMFLLVILGGLKKWWVFGWVYREHERELYRQVEEWKALAMSGTELAAKAVTKNGSSPAEPPWAEIVEAIRKGRE